MYRRVNPNRSQPNLLNSRSVWPQKLKAAECNPKQSYVWPQKLSRETLDVTGNRNLKPWNVILIVVIEVDIPS